MDLENSQKAAQGGNPLPRDALLRYLEAFSGNGLSYRRGIPDMKKYKTVKGVCALTGLTGKHLYYFHHENVVRATAYANYSVEGNDGYKLYDEAAVERLQQIALYYRLGLKRNEIRDMMRAPDYDSNKVLEDLIRRLQEKRTQIERQLLALEYIQTTGTKNAVAGLLLDVPLETLGEALQRGIVQPDRETAAATREAAKGFAAMDSREPEETLRDTLFGADNAAGFLGILRILISAVGEGTGACGITPDQGKKALTYLAKHPEIYEKYLSTIDPEQKKAKKQNT